MGNHLVSEVFGWPQKFQGEHECEVFGKGLETAESSHLWENCEKHSGHEMFLPIEDFMEKHLPKPLPAQLYDSFRQLVDLTVRLRVQWTSRGRPDDDEFSHGRGTDMLRVGSGYVYRLAGPESSEPCPCIECDARVAKRHWKFYVRTARHVVYDTDEAKDTRVDLFYNDDRCDVNGRMKSVRAVRVVGSSSDFDACCLLCVTHDEALAEELRSLRRGWQGLLNIDESSPAAGYADLYKDLRAAGSHEHLLMVSHPHGQPKRITVGSLIRKSDRLKYDGSHLKYSIPSCKGSSGAPVFTAMASNSSLSDFTLVGYNTIHASVHCGTENGTSQRRRGVIVNYGNNWYNACIDDDDDDDDDDDEATTGTTHV